jgi:ATP-dependent helicase/nuclease subunit A
VLTFTEAAANEMRTRIADALRARLNDPASSAPGRRLTPADHDRRRWLRRQAAMVDRASISTLHAFCGKVLRQHFHEARIDPGFDVMDEEEARLLRDDVLDDLLAAWHKDAGDAGRRFAAFLEAYAQGRDAACRDHVLRLHDLLASTADPAAFVAAARHLYSPDGRRQTFDAYLRDVVGGELRLLALLAGRACDDVRRHVGPGPMLDWLNQMRDLADWAHSALAKDGPAAWAPIRDAFSCKWQTCKTVKDVDDFEAVKKRTWVALKDRMDRVCDKTLAADPAALLADLAPLSAPLDALLEMAHAFDAAFTAAKRAQNRLDFQDLERLTHRLLSGDHSLAAQDLRQRYHHLLVDEFQDINPLQDALLAAVRSPLRFGGAGNLFAVGDVKQSIYAFRLANPDLFLARERAWRQEQNKFVALQHNFRSRPALLHVMNGLFERLLTPPVAGIHYADGHALVPGPAPAASDGALPAPLPSLAHPVEVHLVLMDQEDGDDEAAAGGGGDDADRPGDNLSAVEHEARLVADQIAALVASRRPVRTKDGGTRPVEYRDIAVLLRSVRSKAMLFARALDRRGIPAHADLATGFFDTPEVRDALALLQVLDNPRQDIPLATVMLGPYGGFSHDDLAVVRLTYDRKEVPFAEAAARYAADTAAAEQGIEAAGVHEIAPAAPPFSVPLADRLSALFAKLGRWRERLQARPLHEGLAEIYAESKVLAYVAALDAGAQRVANLQLLHARALKFAGFRKQGLHRFLRFIDKLRDGDGDAGEAPVVSDASDVVRIMSVHKSKGLEFPVVFAAGLGGRLQLHDRGPVYLHRDLGVGLLVADVEKNVFYPSAASARVVDAAARAARAEELRLLYVALTRARDHLVLTGHVGKKDRVDGLRRQWRGHDGPLPEDVLLRGSCALDWLLPALACAATGGEPSDPAALQTCWDPPAAGGEQVVVHFHPRRADGDPVATAAASPDDRIARLLAGAPLADAEATAPPPDPAVARLITRVTGVYPHAAVAAQPAVRTVTFLKTLADGFGEEAPAADLPDDLAGVSIDSEAARDPAAAEAARRRGVATHRILELLDFADVASPAAVDAQIARLVDRRALSADDADRADWHGIRWFLARSAAGRRVVAAARHLADTPAAAGRLLIRRELPFTWVAPTGPHPSAAPADWPTVRGVIDLLLVDLDRRTAEILDYKTDSTRLWQSRAPDYERQMHYYLRAAADILGFPVRRATLLFLSPQVELEVSLPHPNNRDPV